MWNSGWFRLAVLAVALGAIGAVVALANRETPPSAQQRAAAERARLVKLHREIARLRVQQRRDPVLRRERARLRAEQRPHFGHAPVQRPPSRAGQEALVGAVERSITRDANRRFRAGLLDKPTLRTYCVHLVRPQVANPPAPPLSAERAGYECTAATTKSHTELSPTGTAIFGFPFWARVNFRTGGYAWCKINPLPGEAGIGGSLAFVPLEPACDLLKGGGGAA
jgi:hypothetical protein